ncbi:17595_t:CDS:2 [Acaulospora colombiana]|uniref:17595_t:CDS:1 n=1 Tax=Acaulospora colombiana TaxID=27376 RepID=A0ACA9NET3_9GLOM|nr:17595_t:CDS:2 [Acaulospora colombiana]
MSETTMISASCWLEEAVDQGCLNFHDFEKFSDFTSIGNGPFGEVYRAQWKIRGLVVALKSWMDATGKEEKKMLDGFISELKMHRKVDYHPNILRFYGMSQGDDSSCENFKGFILLSSSHHVFVFDRPSQFFLSTSQRPMF